ncbi:hypothetical protein P280DRAFT_545797 [Massarina eburnea CBS 473.64]|uniref:Uncharacterized protein n=1 Tax=Massarina eburnea CBS 473.64 TaxID=1395130 RepID=A0A6A6SF52_9PLEO|nr:hypothetical protein P280DRAFT_545797 [Massarina eburnea CBS 473.64]
MFSTAQQLCTPTVPMHPSTHAPSCMVARPLLRFDQPAKIGAQDGDPPDASMPTRFEKRNEVEATIGHASKAMPSNPVIRNAWHSGLRNETVPHSNTEGLACLTTEDSIYSPDRGELVLVQDATNSDLTPATNVTTSTEIISEDEEMTTEDITRSDTAFLATINTTPLTFIDHATCNGQVSITSYDEADLLPEPIEEELEDDIDDELIGEDTETYEQNYVRTIVAHHLEQFCASSPSHLIRNSPFIRGSMCMDPEFPGHGPCRHEVYAFPNSPSGEAEEVLRHRFQVRQLDGGSYNVHLWRKKLDAKIAGIPCHERSELRFVVSIGDEGFMDKTTLPSDQLFTKDNPEDLDRPDIDPATRSENGVLEADQHEFSDEPNEEAGDMHLLSRDSSLFDENVDGLDDEMDFDDPPDMRLAISEHSAKDSKRYLARPSSEERPSNDQQGPTTETPIEVVADQTHAALDTMSVKVGRRGRAIAKAKQKTTEVAEKLLRKTSKAVKKLRKVVKIAAYTAMAL